MFQQHHRGTQRGVGDRRYQRVSGRATESGGWDSPEEEASVYVDFLRLVLEMINTVTVSCLPQNPELVYALLHRQDVLVPLQVGSCARQPG